MTKFNLTFLLNEMQAKSADESSNGTHNSACEALGGMSSTAPIVIPKFTLHQLKLSG